MAATAPANQSAPDFPKTAPVSGGMAANTPNAAIPKTAPLIGGEIGKTMALNVNEDNIDPVRGWLVCIEGNKKGQDFKIQSERNFIGRSKNNQVSLPFDDAISKDRHSELIYDLKANKFYINNVDGASNIYLNDQIVLNATQLNPYDIITIGETRLSFVPFCTDAFKW